MATGEQEQRIIEADRSIILAADMEPDDFEAVVEDLADIDGLSAVKLGFAVGLSRIGLPGAVDIVKCADSDLVAIYDHQKAGTDIPDTGKAFARAMEDADIDAAILFPQAGPETQKAWTAALQDRDIGVIVGAEMTHPGYMHHEGGYLTPADCERIYVDAIEAGVRDFVVPGNKPERVEYYARMFRDHLGAGNFALYSPGLVAQGGEISDAAKVAGKRWHAIIGRGIFQAANVRMAAIEHASQIVNQEAA